MDPTRSKFDKTGTPGDYHDKPANTEEQDRQRRALEAEVERLRALEGRVANKAWGWSDEGIEVVRGYERCVDELKAQLREHGGHTEGCIADPRRGIAEKRDVICTCGWAEIEKGLG